MLLMSARKFFAQNLKQRLQSGTICSEHTFADNLHGHRSLPHEAIVKFLQTEVGAAQFLVILPQFEDLQLTQSVIEIGGVGRTPSGLDLRHGRDLEALLDEKRL